MAIEKHLRYPQRPDLALSPLSAPNHAALTKSQEDAREAIQRVPERPFSDPNSRLCAFSIELSGSGRIHAGMSIRFVTCMALVMYTTFAHFIH